MLAAIPLRNFDQSCPGARENASGRARTFYQPTLPVGRGVVNERGPTLRLR